MGRKTAVAIAAALIVGPIVALIGYKHWLDTRTWAPLDIPISLSRGHVRTPDFYINLSGEYHARLDVDYPAIYTPGCAETAWRSLQTHTIGYENGVRIGEADGPTYGNVAVLTADRKGRYTLDVEVLSDASCLNAAHPRLAVWNKSDFPYDGLYQAAIWTVPITVSAGLGLLLYTTVLAVRSHHSTQHNHAILEFEVGRVTTGLPLRKPERARIIAGLPSFPFFAATFLALIVFTEMVFHDPVPSRGIYVSIHVNPPNPEASSSLMPPVVVRIDSGANPGDLPQAYVNSTAVEWYRLKDVLKDELKLRPDWVVYIDGGSNLPFADVAAVAGIAKELHAKVVLLTPETRKLVEPEMGREKSARR